MASTNNSFRYRAGVGLWAASGGARRAFPRQGRLRPAHWPSRRASAHRRTRTKAPAIDIRGAMTRVVSTTRIRRDIADVFDFVTTPKNWPEWHPASISVAGSMDHSLMIGEEVTEEFIAAGRRGRTVWRVTAREAPYLWRIESSESEALATITYRLHTEAGMTVFERDMQYHFGPPMISPKAMFLRRRMERESREALFRAKQILEKS